MSSLSAFSCVFGMLFMLSGSLSFIVFLCTELWCQKTNALLLLACLCQLHHAL